MSEATIGSLDPIDREILAILQTDGRLSGADIGRKVNLSQPAVSARIQRLERSGVITGYRAVVDPADVAAAILRTCHTRQAEIAVPRWLAAWKVLDGLTPSSLMTLGRRLAGDDRGLTADATARAAYTDRVATFTHSREA